MLYLFDVRACACLINEVCEVQQRLGGRKNRYAKCIYLQDFLKFTSKYITASSLSVGHYELCRDDIGDLPGSPEHL